MSCRDVDGLLACLRTCLSSRLGVWNRVLWGSTHQQWPTCLAGLRCVLGRCVDYLTRRRGLTHLPTCLPSFLGVGGFSLSVFACFRTHAPASKNGVFFRALPLSDTCGIGSGHTEKGGSGKQRSKLKSSTYYHYYHLGHLTQYVRPSAGRPIAWCLCCDWESRLVGDVYCSAGAGPGRGDWGWRRRGRWW